MKTIDLVANPLSTDELLDSARHESVAVRSHDGVLFVVSAADEFASEVQLLRRNHRFLSLLDSLKQDRHTIPLGEIEERLRT